MPRKRRNEDENLLDDMSSPFTPEPEDQPADPEPSVPEQAPEEEKPAPANTIKLEAFLSACGRKWDQTASFKHFAKTNKLGPMSMLDWMEAFKEFQNRPTR